METNTLVSFGGYAIFFVLGLVFMVIPIVAGSFLRPKNPSRAKQAVYECGEPTIGTSWIRYNIRFYSTALDFLIFDVEVVLLLPVAVALRQVTAAHGAGVGFAALGVVGVFFFVLALGLAYAWRYGTIDWVLSEITNKRPAPQPAHAALPSPEPAHQRAA